MTWGFERKCTGGLTINARMETLWQRPMFAYSIQSRRCILPASQFYEWDADKHKATFCGANDELLFIEWLSTLLFEMDCRKMLFSRFEVAINHDKLTAVCRGEKIDVVRHQPAVEVKGATYMLLSVKQNDDGKWIAQCVVDV